MKMLQKILDEQGMSGTVLGKKIGLSQPAISFICRTGSTNMSTAIDIAKTLNVSLDYLCGLTQPDDTRHKLVAAALRELADKIDPQ